MPEQHDHFYWYINRMRFQTDRTHKCVSGQFIYVRPIHSHNDYSINRYVNIEYSICQYDMSLRSFGHLNWRKRNRFNEFIVAHLLFPHFHSISRILKAIFFLQSSHKVLDSEKKLLKKMCWRKKCWKIQSKWIELFPLNMKKQQKKKSTLKKSAHAIAFHSVKITCEQKSAVYHSCGSS